MSKGNDKRKKKKEYLSQTTALKEICPEFLFERLFVNGWMFEDGGRNMQIGSLLMMLTKNNLMVTRRMNDLQQCRFGDEENVFE